MNSKQYVQRFKEVIDQMLATTIAKNHDYAATDDTFGNFRAYEIVGSSAERGILTRMVDKITRVSNLLDKEAKVKDESMTDSLLDLAVYAIILAIYLEQKS